LHRHVPKK